MPRGKELAQLPKSNIASDAGTDKGIMNVDPDYGFAGAARPMPSQVKKEEKR
ncbi:hypothetical protein ACFSO7_14520 [Bacillus sp. CGMCC 1.16607]|uniref:hypothetical protein n=1 Tax=Bacillus sp. CGMCC 1.16607 TaxID=3351842 RepID=UPI003645C0F3